jgi:hypothetical protein
MLRFMFTGRGIGAALGLIAGVVLVISGAVQHQWDILVAGCCLVCANSFLLRAAVRSDRRRDRMPAGR